MKLKILLFFVALSGLSYGFYLFEFAARPDLDSKIIEIFNLRDFDNNPIKQARTDFIIINFWASWCPPCNIDFDRCLRTKIDQCLKTKHLEL